MRTTCFHGVDGVHDTVLRDAGLGTPSSACACQRARRARHSVRSSSRAHAVYYIFQRKRLTSAPAAMLTC
jgi:hypothetical protein